MNGPDWQDGDPSAYDPDNPRALAEKAAATPPDERAMKAVWAVRSMLAGEATAGALIAAKDYMKRHKVMTAADFDRLVREARIESGSSDSDRGPTVSAILAGYALEQYTLHRDTEDEPYALPIDGPRVARYLRGTRSLRAELAGVYLKDRGTPAASAALADALAAIEGYALNGEIRETHLRVARSGDAVYFDLGRDDGVSVRIVAGSWNLLEDAPVVWRRTRKTRLLPDPVRGSSLDALWAIARVPQPSQPLVASWQVCALLDLVTPILDLTGEHGSGKSAAATAIAGTIDTAKPGTVPSTAVDLVVGAAARRITILDNLTHIQPWLSDALCRLVTGDELDRRALYSDSDVATLSLRRPLMTTSIDIGAVPADYTDRLVTVAIPLLDEASGMEESAWQAAWADAQPRAMGAILDLACRVLAALPDIRLDRTPRMGDYSRVLAAVDQVLGTDGLAEYRAQRKAAAAGSVEADVIGPLLLQWLNGTWPGDGPVSWDGSMSDLLERLTPDPQPRDWPRSPRALQARLAKLAKPLRQARIEITSTGAKEPLTRRTMWRVERAPAPSFDPSDPSQTPADVPERGEGSSEGSLDEQEILRTSFAQEPASDLREEEAKDLKDPAGTSSHPAGRTFSAFRQPGKVCSKCHREPAGTGGILCGGCKAQMTGARR